MVYICDKKVVQQKIVYPECLSSWLSMISICLSHCNVFLQFSISLHALRYLIFISTCKLHAKAL